MQDFCDRCFLASIQLLLKSNLCVFEPPNHKQLLFFTCLNFFSVLYFMIETVLLQILKTWPLTTVRRWAASPNSFTLVSKGRIFFCNQAFAGS